MRNTHPWSVGDSVYHPDTVTITTCDQFSNLFININMLHVRKLTDIVFLCTRTKYNNLSFLENHSCVKITHATFIILKSFSVQYFSQKSWTSVIFSVWQCPLFLLTWRFYEDFYYKASKKVIYYKSEGWQTTWPQYPPCGWGLLWGSKGSVTSWEDSIKQTLKNKQR